MRFVLFPAAIPERCTLFQAVNWVLNGAYPVDEHFESEEISAVEYWGRQLGVDDGQAGARERVFASFASGHIVGRGKFSNKRAGSSGADTQDWALWKWMEPEPSTPETEIPNNFWRLKGISWNDGWARSPIGEFKAITIPTQDLFRAFPEPPLSEQRVIERRGDFYLMEAEGTKSKVGAGGRPPKYDWRAFDVEIVMVANSLDGLPETQAELERRMLDWCQMTWGREPAPSLVRDRIAPHYAALRKRGRK